MGGALIQIIRLFGSTPHFSLLNAVRPEYPVYYLFLLFEVCACKLLFCFAVSLLNVVCSLPATSVPSFRALMASGTP
jgi:hypothetical protein